MNYEPVIGLEIHLQPKTKTKMFSRVSADYFGKAPNVNVDPVSLGLPGALPVPNRRAIEQCLRLSLALGCEINKQSKFDRKNYFYPDLPKGYQISQYDQPIGFEGALAIRLKDGEKTIRITRVHMEEDTGKSIHEGNVTLLDFNKAGVPLIEVVTEPDFTSGEEIDAFAKRLRQIIRYLGVSDADMEKGQLRYELNISLRKPGEKDLPNYKVEVKNIGSISLLQKVLEFETKRQAEILDRGETPVQETRGTRDMTGKTHSQRVKEEADDYRYFPEPDIPPLEFNDDYLAELKNSLPILPGELEKQYLELGMNPEHAEAIVAEQERSELLEEFRGVITKADNAAELSKEFAKYIIGDLANRQTADSDLKALTGDLEQVAEVLSRKIAGSINSTTQKSLLKEISEGKFASAEELKKHMAAENLESQGGAEQFTDFIRKAIAAEAGAKERFAKNPNLAMFFVGQVMKESRGKANPAEVKELVIKLLSE
jgi:aspartyl-tRNA(Asn)/glutamyl-tRNA(Gln) amidotransferase subunit B